MIAREFIKMHPADFRKKTMKYAYTVAFNYTNKVIFWFLS